MAGGSAWRGRHLAALIIGNVALALGPWAVRLADCGPVSAAFWRLTLALPVLLLLARANRQLIRVPGRVLAALALAGVLFALDLASWHIGIARTRLGNATLFGNSGSVVLMVWGLVAAARRPRAREIAALACALAGGAVLFARSLALSQQTLVGDLFSLAAGLFYAGYILLLQQARARLGNWALLAGTSAAGAPLLLALAAALHEPVWPQHWGPLLALALGSQIIGQGLLVYALRHFSALVIGLMLLMQPIVGVLAGWLAFGEALTPADALGMALVAAALVLVKAGER